MKTEHLDEEELFIFLFIAVQIYFPWLLLDV